MGRPDASAEAVSIAGSFKRANILAFGFALLIGGFGVFGGLKAPAPLILLVAALLAFFGARRWLDRSSDVYKFRDAEAATKQNWLRAQQQWAERTGSATFDAKKQEVLKLRTAIDYLPQVRASKLDKLKKSVR
ncbi:hypothetical protein XI03_09535 [Bradyrhizobium sp. CCBAU 65884]|nr:hypothetical protein [Bradyrhizobium sp. CCBAU 65884]